jgi:Pretoxin HINT domain
MTRILRALLTCLALASAFAASASGMRAPAVERVDATEATAISTNQFSLQNSAVFRRGYLIVRYQNISECEAEETADTTEGHPFNTTDGWRDAVLLKKGGQPLLKGGGGDAADGADAAITIAEVRQEVKTVAVYNLEVANAHTFFVGADGVLVHNGGEGVYVNTENYDSKSGTNVGQSNDMDRRLNEHRRNPKKSNVSPACRIPMPGSTVRDRDRDRMENFIFDTIKDWVLPNTNKRRPPNKGK